MQLMSLLLLSFLSLFACGAREKIEQVFPRHQSKGDKSALQGEASPGSFTWAEMPVYPGAIQIEKEITATPLEVTKADYKEVEYRCYQTAEPVEEVAAFYLAEMPKKGCKKLIFMGFGTGSFLTSWDKNRGEMVATVTTLNKSEDGKTDFIIIKGQGKK